MITVILPGHPQGKGRARSFRRGNFVGHYTPEKTRSYEGMIRDAAAQAMAGRAPFAEPVELVLDAVFDVPASWSKKKRTLALDRLIWPGKKPDLDNIVKAATDALNGVVFKDDALIVSCQATKIYGDAPMLKVSVTLVQETKP